MKQTVKDLEFKAKQVKKGVLDMVYASKAGHIGGPMSSIDILTTLYYKILNIDSKKFSDPDRDRFLLSKGHIAESLYYILGDRGFLIKRN